VVEIAKLADIDASNVPSRLKESRDYVEAIVEYLYRLVVLDANLERTQPCFYKIRFH